MNFFGIAGGKVKEQIAKESYNRKKYFGCNRRNG